MTNKEIQKMKAVFPKVVWHISLAPLTTFRVGGRALAYLTVKKPEELLATVKEAQRHRFRYQIMAGGSNVVCADGLYRGLLIHYLPPRNGVAVEGEEVVSEAGVLLAILIKRVLDLGLAGLESLSGIPGTVGGAVVGNAGAYGQAISDKLVAVQIWDGKRLRWISKIGCRFKYRDSVFKHRDWIVLRIKFKLTSGDGKELRQKSAKIIRIRHKKYPPALLCPGSFFKNILVKDVPRRVLAKIDKAKIVHGKIPAGYLLEEVGAKGVREGGIFVASYHGNLLINDGTGTCARVRRLATKLKARVKRRFGINLEEEVRYMVK